MHPYRPPVQHASQKAAHKAYAAPKYVAPKHVAQDRTLSKHTSQKSAVQARASQKLAAQKRASQDALALKRASASQASVAQRYRLQEPASTSKSEILMPRHRGMVAKSSTKPGKAISTRNESTANQDKKTNAKHNHTHHSRPADYYYANLPWWYDDYWDVAYWHHYYHDGYAWYTDGSLYDYRVAQRQLAINAIQSQIAAAMMVLNDAVSREEMSKSTLDDAHQRVLAARAAMDGAAAEEHQSSKSMQEIEVRLMSEQGPGSELIQAQAKVDSMREALDREVHRVLALPAHAERPTAADYAHEVAMLTPAQKGGLKKDAGFRQASDDLRAAVRDVVSVRHALFEKDSDWSAAKQAAVEAAQRQRTASNDLARDAGLSQFTPKRELRSAQELAAEARATIATGKAALRMLGVHVPVDSSEQTQDTASPST